LGLGWGHSYNGSVQELGCGAYQIAGGLGGGGRFYLQGDEFVPAKGYHGTLKKDDTENTFDFYTKDGTRYHYRRYSFNSNRSWNLAYIEDVNGNQVLLEYDQSDGKGKLLSVTDSAGRMLSFEYNGDYAGDGEQVALVGSVTGPEGYRVDYAYDDDDRLVSVTTHNNGNDQVEIYTYPEVDGEYEDIYEYYERHTLQSITDPLGYTTSYTYLRLPFNHVVGAVPNLAVDTIVRTTAQNGSVSMDFDYSDRGSAGSGTTTDVNNFRGDTVHYVMDGGGRLLSQSLPDIRYEWYTDDILLKRRTQTYQGGEISTAYTYDEHGNITSETLNGRPPITRTWYAPDAFKNGAIKNRLKSEADRNGHTTEYAYDDRGNLTEIRYPEDASERYTYASNGDRVSSRDGNGNTVNYSYDDNGYVTRADASDCCDSTFGWNDLGYKTLSSDGRGRVTRYANDRLGRVLEINYPEGVSESFSYDAAGNRTDHYNRRGTHIVYEYDEAGRVVAETWPTTGSRAMRYDPHGNLVEATDFRGVTTYHEYDVRDHLVRSSTAGDDVTRTSLFVVDEQGNVVREDHGEGRVTERVFNDLGLPEEITDANGQTSYRSYDHVGNLVSTTDRRGHETTYQYDGRNRLVRQDEPLGRILRWTYDANGNVASETDANGNVTERDWTQHGKPRSVAVRDASGSTLSSRLYRYDAAGNLEEESNSRGAVTAYAYDDLNRLIRVDRPSPLGDLRYTAYDGNGNVEREVWPNGNVVERTWDERDRLLSESDSLGARRALTYDNNGNVLTETDARGTTVTRTWTSFNQVKSESLPQHGDGDLQVSYAYDSQGNLRFRRVNDTLSGLPEMTWETRYDVLNRPTDEIDPLNRVQVTVYDEEGNPERVTNRRNNVTTYSYDALNRLQQVNEPLGRQRVLGYDAHGNLTSELDGRGFVTRYTYDGLHRRIETARNDLVILRENYDGEGNLLKRTDANGNATSYEYLDANLLSQETGEEAVVTRYGYDA
ncbi:MAG: RHS repeat protein, partial [Alcanivoracaceae bacterium]|nr:RHS repeat protein [Alcanivoracaceae bacterium]